MLQPVVHHNSDGPNNNGGSLHSSPDEDDFNMERNWESGVVCVFIFYFAFSIKYYFIDFQPRCPCLPRLHVVSN